MKLKKWWHDKIVYEIYPKSFMDANNDGIGDIKGIIGKLDYLKELGVDILWLTPFFKSPMEDNGYDISDYLSVNEMFGSMKDMDELIEKCKERNMYIMMDVVLNHTSSEHNWFKQSRKSKDNAYRNYYIWRDEPLYNMESTFGGSAWEYDDVTNQYYFHEFAKGQPDLNWENPKVMDEMSKCINFWLKKGIKGIRFDVIHLIGKEIDNNILSYGPTLHKKVHELYEKSYGKYDIITVGEAWGDLKKAIDFTNPSNEELDMVFQFECTSSTCDFSKYGKFSPKPIDMEFVKNTLVKYQNGLNDHSWNALFVENHDLGRCINRFGSLNYQDMSAKAIAIMNYCLKGTPYIYQGQEIGMTNILINDINDYQDVEVHGFYKDLVIDKKVMSEKDFIKACNQEARDNNRTPMQWDDSINAGFNKGFKTWMKVNDNYHEINVKENMKNSDSIFHFYQKLFAIRKSEEYGPTFVYGKFDLQLPDEKNVFVYTRNYDKNICIVVNMVESEQHIILPFKVKNIILANYNKEYHDGNIKLSPFEAFVYEY
ncbi:MAG: alpha-glucosidase [Erysipelotrichaceae bacterium]|nr:alpha-glucosidase [Erysipelotrichaceae bacterium]